MATAFDPLAAMTRRLVAVEPNGLCAKLWQTVYPDTTDCEKVVHRGVIQTSYFRLVITTWVAFAVVTRSVQ
jgi:hypothetical protein